MNDKIIPARLYKYRPFNEQTLNTLIADQLFYATPSTFNDPLDTNPSLEVDTGSEQLEQILEKLVVQRAKAEMTAAAKAINYKGPKTKQHIQNRSLRIAESEISNIQHNVSNPEYDYNKTLLLQLSYKIEQELLQRYDKGVVSLTKNVECPVMWSHYGDQHRGMAIGYSVPSDVKNSLHEINYGGNRTVKASKVLAMLHDDETAKREVDDAVLLQKAEAWCYEQEWRLIGSQGLNDSLLELEEVVFGVRCPPATQFAVLKALEGRQKEVDFFEIKQHNGKFELTKNKLEIVELEAHFPKRARSVYEAFSNIEAK